MEKKIIYTTQTDLLMDMAEVYRLIVADYFIKTGKKLHITFCGSKGYFDGLLFDAEGQEGTENFISFRDLEKKKKVTILDTKKGVELVYKKTPWKPASI